MEFAYKYGILGFLIHDLTPETQFLAATGYATGYFLCVRNKLHIIFERKIF